MIRVSEFVEDKYLVMVTRQGIIKRIALNAYNTQRKGGLIALELNDGDELAWVKMTDGNDDIIIATQNGMAIRFKETDVRATGRTSMGVRGMNLADDDEVVAMQLNTQGHYLLVVSEKGMGKLTCISDFSAQNRGGKGVKCYRITEKTGNVAGAKAVNDENEIMMITTEGIIIRIACEDISIQGRITSGVKLINLSDGVKVASFAKVREKKDEEQPKEPAVQDTEGEAEQS